MPNTATTASPTNFCTWPPWRSNSARMWSNQAAITTASDSGSRRSPSRVDPATSVETTVTVLRAGRAEVDGSGVPQARQKLALVGSPQAGQTVMASRYRPAAPPPRFFSASLRRRTASISAWSAAVGSRVIR